MKMAPRSGITTRIYSWKNALIVELKAVRAIDNGHVAPILGYLRASRIEMGLLINFGASKLSVKEYSMTEKYAG